MENKKTTKEIKPLILIILDGWGIAPPSQGNAVTLAKTPVVNKLIKDYPYTELCAHGSCVGLPEYQDGNSEAGHMNIGAGRVVGQDVIRITKAVKDGTFYKNSAFLQAIKHAKENRSHLHLMGLLSNGMSAHSDPEHIMALLRLARKHGIKNTYLHLFTDGRDSPQYAALKLIQNLEKKLLKNEYIATVMGRYYGMDRKKNWPVTEQAYDVLTCEKCRWRSAASAIDAVTESYNRKNTDEFMEPYVILRKGKSLPRIDSNDAIIFFNLRSDRARQIAKAFIQKNFEKMNRGSFKRKKLLENFSFTAMTDFGPDLENILTAYPSVDLWNTLPILLADKRQFYIAETEKYAHVTYFFNGGYADPVAGELRFQVASPDVKSYDQTPEMSSGELTEMLLRHIKEETFDFITINYACPDMIGHTGNLAAGIKAVEGVDKYLGKVIKEADKKGVNLIITADHGNIEEMINLKTGEVDTEHSTNPVPFILFDGRLRKKKKILREKGILGDVAPTVLRLLGKEHPKEMAGKSLLNYK
ncbi:2,3-bisphosphoglycerate-independent phosphoglycerate mutase [Candidatus Falkowbacteria bacterium CG10_big_fil_rev_8_21_14_0_10_43_10]|uniref:2,3-bisphosphoglycerate-independent phosphoglycerate mutase n=1 Tax=Candidatus Falkowbacteria bacterium CG10_big_fil_rev_8_21_14_0_10_43_10 TaxID=1974567 RepID=A0A2H0V297_9BACT|nr:MAG: 2,3-bisphosphoglycerate-independent phosphoglycerate mutase [Candidatus Falkowbacteria bacterium CG10_big_fil_rev_8_21_14_0_10_43_10]